MHGQWKDFVMPATISTDNTESNAVDIQGANAVAIDLPTFAAGITTATANVYVKVSNSATGTFRRLVDMGEYSGGAGLQEWEVPSGTGDIKVLCRGVQGFGFMKVETSNTATANFAVQVHKMF